jgi:hypothetical protein
MSIENEIKKLRESIDWLTNAIIESKKPIITENRIDTEVQKISIGYKPVEKVTPIEEQSKTIKKVEIKVESTNNLSEKDKKERKFPKVEIQNPPKPLEYEIDNEKNEVKVKVTYDMVKQLGKEKMSAGVDRSKIKSIITSLAGADASIADLDEFNIEECYNKISELQPE